MESLKHFLASYGIFSEQEIDDFLRSGESVKLQKSDYFIREGEICQTIAFVKSGLVRSYYTTESGEDNTYCFIFPGRLLGAYSSFISGDLTHENMQAITPTELVLFSKREIERLAEHSLNWLRFMKQVAEEQYIELEQRVFQLQSVNAKQRYINLLEAHPEYIREIPLQCLASYLGITQRHLSRLRKETVAGNPF